MKSIELEMEKILDSDSDFIKSLCENLEEEGIHLTNDLLFEILSAYEEKKLVLFKDILEKLVEQDNLSLDAQGGSPVLQIVFDMERCSQGEEEDEEADGFNFETNSSFIM